MGFFGGNFNKPGKGVTKEEAEKRNYFDILGRRVGKLVQLNLLYVLCNILFFGAALLLLVPYDWGMLLEAFVQNKVFIFPLLPFLPLMLTGPFTAGLTYVVRNYSRQEHAFMMSDFFEHSRKNLKQGLAMSIINYGVLYLFITAFIFYRAMGVNQSFLLGITFVLGVMLIHMSFYVYPMMITFDMKLRHIIKNAWIFSMAKFLQNFFILAILALVHGLLLWYVFPIWCVLMVVVLIAWSGFTINYYVWHVMNKHIISQIEEQNEEIDEEEIVFEDEMTKK